jgi:site-specific recombinase XerD
LLLDAGVAIESVQGLLEHKHITTTQIYDKAATLGARLRIAQGADLRGAEWPWVSGH